MSAIPASLARLGIRDTTVIKGYECKFATYCPLASGQFNTKDDVHVIKEYIHLKDKTIIPNVKIVKNFKRKYWVTRPLHQNHKDKKESEDLAKLQEYTCTQSELSDAVSRSLYGRPGGNSQFKQLAKSPYLYGCDISSTALIKKAYEDKFPECMSPQSTVAVLDIETDVVRGTGEILVVTLSFGTRIYVAINTAFISSIGNPEKELQYLANLHLGKILAERNAKVEFAFFDTPGKCCKAVIDKAHEWSPDFVVVWNMDFDVPKITACLEREQYDLAEVFSDPRVPKEHRFYKYKQGKAQKVTQAGKVMSLNPADRWHVATFPAGFYIVDAMCIYRRIRMAKGNEPSYALDAILKKHLKIGKLSLSQYDHLHGLAWHQAMQKEEPFFYVIYNIFDCVGVELLDEITNDVRSTFPTLCGNSDFNNFTSNPRRLVDDLHYFFLERKKVIATTGMDLVTDDDELVIGLKEWIITVPAHLIAENGVNIISGYETQVSMIRIHLADLDIEGTYPNIQVAANVAKETTLRELARIDGVSERVQRLVGINLSGGIVNAIEIGNMVLGLPTPDVWLIAALNDPDF